MSNKHLHNFAVVEQIVVYKLSDGCKVNNDQERVIDFHVGVSFITKVYKRNLKFYQQKKELKIKLNISIVMCRQVTLWDFKN